MRSPCRKTFHIKALIDADLVAFRSSAAAEKEDCNIAVYYAENLIDQIVSEVGASSYQLYLTGKSNFRYQIYPEYKGNRLDMYRPRHLHDVRGVLLDRHSAILSVGCEADDLLGVAQCSGVEKTTICSLDKDLLMIPGRHYSWEISGVSKGTRWVKPANHRIIDEDQALRWFYTQVLIGDNADNIKGASGVGKVGAAKILAGCNTHAEYIEAIRPYFSGDDEIEMNAACLWIWRKDNDIWRIKDYTSISES